MRYCFFAGIGAAERIVFALKRLAAVGAFQMVFHFLISLPVWAESVFVLLMIIIYHRLLIMSRGRGTKLLTNIESNFRRNKARRGQPAAPLDSFGNESPNPPCSNKVSMVLLYQDLNSGRRRSIPLSRALRREQLRGHVRSFFITCPFAAVLECLGEHFVQGLECIGVRYGIAVGRLVELDQLGALDL